MLERCKSCSLVIPGITQTFGNKCGAIFEMDDTITNSCETGITPYWGATNIHWPVDVESAWKFVCPTHTKFEPSKKNNKLCRNSSVRRLTMAR